MNIKSIDFFTPVSLYPNWRNVNLWSILLKFSSLQWQNIHKNNYDSISKWATIYLHTHKELWIKHYQQSLLVNENVSSSFDDKYITFLWSNLMFILEEKHFIQVIHTSVNIGLVSQHLSIFLRFHCPNQIIFTLLQKNRFLSTVSGFKDCSYDNQLTSVWKSKSMLMSQIHTKWFEDVITQNFVIQLMIFTQLSKTFFKYKSKFFVKVWQWRKLCVPCKFEIFFISAVK